MILMLITQSLALWFCGVYNSSYAMLLISVAASENCFPFFRWPPLNSILAFYKATLFAEIQLSGTGL
jgi:hypothetical protein